MIETILRLDISNDFDWYHLTDLEAGKLKQTVHEVISSKCGEEIEKLFIEIIERRNRIIHSYRITNAVGEQVLATKERVSKGNRQFEITEEYLLDFIKLNDELSGLLYKLRGY